MNKINIKYRNWFKGLPPQRTKLQIPGWAGDKTHDLAQPWHCKPFADGATYGIEIVYPYESEARVTLNEDQTTSNFKFESTNEWDDAEVPVPFRNFAPSHFGVTSATDLQTDPGYGVLILPHARFFTDTTGTVPVPSIGLIETDWWPKIFFIAFKAPLKGQEYIFRKGEGIAQALIVPKNIEYNIQEMTKKEKQQRENQELMLTRYGSKIATRKWADKQGFSFDNKYKVLSTMDKREQQDASKFLRNMEDHDKLVQAQKELERNNKIQRKLIKPERKW